MQMITLVLMWGAQEIVIIGIEQETLLLQAVLRQDGLLIKLKGLELLNIQNTFITRTIAL